MQTYSKKINILDDLDITINIDENKYNLPLEDVFSMAARKNPKRAFLFVSKLLGKHYPIHPSVGILTGTLLANELTPCKYLSDVIDNIALGVMDKLSLDKTKTLIEYLEVEKLKLDKSTLFIGFAETATGLGHSVFSNFKKKADSYFEKDSYYIHTTREEIKDLKSAFEFEEEHSHATTHLCYPNNKDIFQKVERIVLVDDEISTGKTNLNLIRSLNKVYPIKEFVCMSILDWRNEEQIHAYKLLEEELNIKIRVISLIKGTLSCNNKIIDTKKQEDKNILENNDFKFFECEVPCNSVSKYKLSNLNNNKENFLNATGRFGVSSANNDFEIQDIVDRVQRLNLSIGSQTLVMGLGEFIFIPMQIAFNLNPYCKFSSPSLSPIHIDNKNNYPLNNVDIINCPYGINKDYHIYNLNNKDYNQVVLFLERKPSESFVEQLKTIVKNRKIKYLSLVYFK